MLKVQTVRKQLETFFKKNNYRYKYINKEIKSLSVPVYLLGFNIMSEKETDKDIDKKEKDITVMISVFPSNHVICFECLNLYHVDEKESFNILSKLNMANNFSFPGKFALKEEGSVTYCCFMDYTYSEKIHNDIISSIIESIAPAYFIFSDIVNNNKEK